MQGYGNMFEIVKKNNNKNPKTILLVTKIYPFIKVKIGK